MSHTPHSQHFDGELDLKQILKRRGVIADLDQEDFGLSAAERAWMRLDLQCPSCRCGGAILVRSDVAKTGRNSRQAHFRFVDAAGGSAHALACDFYDLDEAPGVQRGVDVNFTANDSDTKIVRELVCKAMSIGELSRKSLFDMRTWFLTHRSENTFVVAGDETAVEWVYQIGRLRTYDAVSFEPFHVTLPGFSIVGAADRHLAFRYRTFQKTLPLGLSAEVRDRAQRIVVTRRGEALIAMAPLRPQFEATKTLAHFMAKYGKLPFRKFFKPRLWEATPPALLAFGAALLFASDWDVNVALQRFARILAAPAPANMTLGNVMGFNPFHDYAALELARFVAGLSTDRPYDFPAERAAIQAQIDHALRHRPSLI